MKLSTLRAGLPVAIACALLVQSMQAEAVQGFDAEYVGESAFLTIAKGESGTFTAFFANRGTATWIRGADTQVDLAACLGDKVTCDGRGDPDYWSQWSSREGRFNSGWLSTFRYATHSQAAVSPGSTGTFTYAVSVPYDVGPLDFRFHGDLVVSRTGERVHPVGYYQGVTAACQGDSWFNAAGRFIQCWTPPPAPGPMIPTSVRTTTDRLDDVQEAQIHVLYLLPSDGVDKRRDLDGSLASSVAAWNLWLAKQTGRRALRIDTYAGAADITFHRLTLSSSDVLASSFTDGVIPELERAGLFAGGKVYAAYYEGFGGLAGCGGGYFSQEVGPDGKPATVRGLAFVPLGVDDDTSYCTQTPLSVDRPGYLEHFMLHEILHVLGAVPTCAPHSVDGPIGAHVSDDEQDVMASSGLREGTPALLLADMTLDRGRDDYYGHGRSDCFDLARSPWLLLGP